MCVTTIKLCSIGGAKIYFSNMYIHLFTYHLYIINIRSWPPATLESRHLSPFSPVSQGTYSSSSLA